MFFKMDCSGLEHDRMYLGLGIGTDTLRSSQFAIPATCEWRAECFGGFVFLVFISTKFMLRVSLEYYLGLSFLKPTGQPSLLPAGGKPSSKPLQEPTRDPRFAPESTNAKVALLEFITKIVFPNVNGRLYGLSGQNLTVFSSTRDVVSNAQIVHHIVSLIF